jgi:hypothetical protein
MDPALHGSATPVRVLSNQQYREDSSFCCDPAGATWRVFSSVSVIAQPQQEPFKQLTPRKSLLASLCGNSSTAGLLRSFISPRHFTVAPYVAAAAPAESNADDVVSQVLSCAASNNTETGVLSQVSRFRGIPCTTANALGQARAFSPLQLQSNRNIDTHEVVGGGHSCAGSHLHPYFKIPCPARFIPSPCSWQNVP